VTSLRDYQSRAYADVQAAFQTHRKVLLVLPTAAGKTVLFAEVCRRIAARGGSILVAAHRRELIRQASNKLRDAGVDHGILMPGHPARQCAVQVGSIQTVGRRLDRLQRFDLIIADEAHHVVAGQWQNLFAGQPGAKLLGVTATPTRLDGRGLGDVFDAMVVGPSVADLIAEGYLSPFRVFAPASPPDVRAIHMLAGDYNPRDLTTVMDRPHITGDAVTHYGRYAPGEPAIVFCTSVAHAEHSAAEFRNEGWRWVCLHGEMPAHERDRALADLAAGRIAGVSSCSLIDEGLDVPRVSVVIDLAPTASLSRFMQRAGRGLRPVYGQGFDLTTAGGRTAAIQSGEKPKLTILDHAGNTLRHGMIDMQPVTPWSLDGRRRRLSAAPPSRQCPECYAIHKPGPVCPCCGFDYDAATAAAQRREIERREGELAEMSASDRRLAILRDSPLDELVSAADTYEAMDEIRAARNYKPGWTHRQLAFKRYRPSGNRTMTGQEFFVP
jgi:DNA repair protein RadD